jgi:hypothetical protein
VYGVLLTTLPLSPPHSRVPFSSLSLLSVTLTYRVC